MHLRHLFLTITISAVALVSQADTDYKQSLEYLTLRDSVHRSFNDGDSARFFRAVTNLENYLLKQDDMHAYYTQRSNEIVFLMNRQKIFEAYLLATKMSKELREKKLDKEMYMAFNMMGHIYRYCGKKDLAKQCFEEVIRRMEMSGYPESMPPIYMNMVSVVMDDDPDEAMRLLEKALSIAKETSPERVFDIEARRTQSYYNMGDKEKFLKGYQDYLQGKAEGKTSVHGRTLDIYYQACTGHTDKAIELCKSTLGNDSYGTMASIYEDAGRWEEAYKALQKEAMANDSINSIILSNSMEGIHNEMDIYEAEHAADRNRIYMLTTIICLLLLLIGTLVYIVLSRRHYMKQLKIAYEHALESDKMKTSFIQNISHEVRTPLNIISGFAQVISDPDFDASLEERKNISLMVLNNTDLVTTLINEMLELSESETTKEVAKEDKVAVNNMIRDIIHDSEHRVHADTKLCFESSLSDDFTMLTNEKMLRQSICALVDNAIKNTTRGQIAVKTATEGQRLRIVVEDTGCGVPEEAAEHIFERFVKLDEFKEGVGLGLPLCRVFIERLEGSVKLDTSFKEGARFVIDLPL